jgi:hypothetical protein
VGVDSGLPLPRRSLTLESYSGRIDGEERLVGTLQYDGKKTTFDDRLLTHLHIVIVQKLRRGDGFAMSWMNALSTGDGRTSIWLDRTIPLRFDFSGSRTPEINREWLQVLAKSADSASGLIITGEDGRLVRCGGPDR